MKKLRNILFFLGIIMISLEIGLVFMNFTVSKQTIEKKLYTVDEAISVLHDSLGYTDRDVEFISKKSKNEFIFRDLVQSQGDTSVDIIVNVRKKTYSVSFQRQHLGESSLNT